MDAIGPFPGAHAGRVAAELASAFAQLRGRPESLRALVTHYAREDLAGRCVAIVTAFHDLPDNTVTEDEAAFAEFVSALQRGIPTPGMLLEVRQVWQLAGSQPRLIEATVELTDAFDTFTPRHVFEGTFPDEAVQAITADITRGGHFEYAGGGARRGIIWCDRSMGLGEPRPWSAAYRLRPAREFGEALDPEFVEALKQFVRRL